MSTDARPVSGFPGYYVCADGSVYSTRHCGRALDWGEREPRRLRPGIAPRGPGYPVVSLSRDGRGHSRTVHSLVAEAFICPRPTALHEVRHLDGNRRNCNAANLAWGTHTENMADVERYSTHWSRRLPERIVRGSRHGQAKLNEEQVARIKGMLRNGIARKVIRAEFGTCKSTIDHIASGHQWGHVTPSNEQVKEAS